MNIQRKSKEKRSFKGTRFGVLQNRFRYLRESEVIPMQNKPAPVLLEESSGEVLPFVEQLKQYQSAGVEITFANANLSLEDIVRICMIREKGEYMCDFVANDRNQITRIDLNPVDNVMGEIVWDGIPVDVETY